MATALISMVPNFLAATQILNALISLALIVSTLYSAVTNLLPQNWALNDATLQASLISAITNLVVGGNATVSKEAFYKLCEEASMYSNQGLLDAPEAYGVLSGLSSINACKATWDQVVNPEKQRFFQRLIQNLPNFSIESLSKNLPVDLLPWVTWLQQSKATAPTNSQQKLPFSFSDWNSFTSFFYNNPSYVTVPVSSSSPSSAAASAILTPSTWHMKLIFVILLLIPLVLFSVPYLYPRIKYYLQKGFKLYNSWFLQKERVELNHYTQKMNLEAEIVSNLKKDGEEKQFHPYLGRSPPITIFRHGVLRRRSRSTSISKRSPSRSRSRTKKTQSRSRSKSMSRSRGSRRKTNRRR
jgi:hypothetical protein